MQLAQRINEAFTLLANQMAPCQVVSELMTRYGISSGQAYRYLQQAKASEDLIRIPQACGVFTVKLPLPLIGQVREQAQSEGLSISKVVSSALENYLVSQDHGQTRQANQNSLPL